ncbi:MAG TPA: hypothetical protein VK698_22005 [Kofleriaceae bacterium]|nr:hypothetical protein [Kofleriaceae bacterium]
MCATSKALTAVLCAALGAACGGGGDDDDDADDVASDAGGDASWELVQEHLPGALLSIWGTAADDIWAVGSDPDGGGPTVLRYDGTSWDPLDTGTVGDLWWVFGTGSGPVYMGGAGGVIIQYDGGEFTEMETPRADVTVFGIWGCSDDDVWAVGGELGGASGAFAWRLERGEDGDRWVEAAGFPTELTEGDAIWKAYGRACDDVWLVGTDGLVVHWDGEAFEGERAGGESLFTVHANADRFVAVGGFGTGTLLENDGTGWVDASPEDVSPLVGVCLTGQGGLAVGQYATVVEREGGAAGAAWAAVDTGLSVDRTMHSVWVDPDGGVWTVGGQVLNAPFVDGVMLHRPAR